MFQLLGRLREDFLCTSAQFGGVAEEALQGLLRLVRHSPEPVAGLQLFAAGTTHHRRQAVFRGDLDRQTRPYPLGQIHVGLAVPVEEIVLVVIFLITAAAAARAARAGAAGAAGAAAAGTASARSAAAATAIVVGGGRVLIYDDHFGGGTVLLLLQPLAGTFLRLLAKGDRGLGQLAVTDGGQTEPAQLVKFGRHVTHRGSIHRRHGLFTLTDLGETLPVLPGRGLSGGG